MNETVQQHADFPSEETLAAYIDGRVDGKTRERVTAHLAECADCYGWWEAAVAGAYEQTNVVPMRRRPWKRIGQVAAALAILAGLPVVVAALPVFSFVTDDVAFLQSIREVVRPNWGTQRIADVGASLENRPVNERVSMLPYRPPERVMRGSVDEANDKTLGIQIVAGQLQRAVDNEPTPQNLHALGAAYLMLKQWENARITLEKAILLATQERSVHAAMQKSRNADLLSDLSIAYLEVGMPKEDVVIGRPKESIASTESAHPSGTPATAVIERGIESKTELDEPPPPKPVIKLPAELTSAIQAIDFAKAVAPSSLNVLYNRAYILEQVSTRNAALRPEAIKAWQTYLALDPKSRWATEAGDHLQRLVS